MLSVFGLGCHIRQSGEMRLRIMKETSSIAVEMADKSLESVETYKPGAIVLNIEDLMRLATRITEMGCVNVGSKLKCDLAVTDFEYCVGASTTTQLALKITSNERPNAATRMTKECRSVRIESAPIDDKQWISVSVSVSDRKESELELEASQLTQVSSEQLRYE